MQLETTTQTSLDAFGAPVYSSTFVNVDNVLVAPATATEVLNATQLHGKKLVYNLAIPKGDSHTWEDRQVKFFGQTFRTFGPVEEGIEALVPGDWHKKVKVERYG